MNHTFRTAATSILIIHWWLVASPCWPILVSMRIFYHWHKKVMDEKEYKGNFPPSNFKPMGMVECWNDHPTWNSLLMAPVKVWTSWPNAKIQICNSLTPAKPNLDWQQVITTKKWQQRIATERLFHVYVFPVVSYDVDFLHGISFCIHA